jgi:hypothetical protein
VLAQIAAQDKQIILQNSPPKTAWLEIELEKWMRDGNPYQYKFALYWSHLRFQWDRGQITDSQFRELIITK